jgi:hypothetical protein
MANEDDIRRGIRLNRITISPDLRKAIGSSYERGKTSREVGDSAALAPARSSSQGQTASRGKRR